MAEEQIYTLTDVKLKLTTLQQRLIGISMNFAARIETGEIPSKAEVSQQKSIKKEYDMLLKIKKDMEAENKSGSNPKEGMNFKDAIMELVKLSQNSKHNIGSLQDKIG